MILELILEATKNDAEKACDTSGNYQKGKIPIVTFGLAQIGQHTYAFVVCMFACLVVNIMK